MENTKITMNIFGHSTNDGHFSSKCQISFSSILTYEARILKNSLESLPLRNEPERTSSQYCIINIE